MNFRKIYAGVMIMAVCFIAVPSLSMARGAPDSFADMAEKLLPAVVNISTKQNVKVGKKKLQRQFPPGSPFEDFFKRFAPNGDGSNGRERTRKRVSLGSGFVIDASGIIITNNHVIDKADEISIKFHDGTELEAVVVGRDTKIDIAVLRVKTKKKLTFVPFGNDKKSRVGDWVIAIGNPYGLGSSVTAGIISARNRVINSGPYDDYIQTDASINRGNSGGPMFNMKGEVIGINTAIFSPTGGNVGIGFAIPSNQARKVVEQIMEFGHTKRGWLGISFEPVTEAIAESLGMDKAKGALVANVSDDSPAKAGGVKTGDIIIEFDGKHINKTRKLPTIVADTPIGKKVRVVVLRKGKKKNLNITIAELKEDEEEKVEEEEKDAEDILGLRLENLNDKSRAVLELDDDIAGVLIGSVSPYGLEGTSRLRRGDVIVEVTQEKVTSVAQLKKRIDALRKKGRKAVLLTVYRADNTFHVAIKFKKKDKKDKE